MNTQRQARKKRAIFTGAILMLSVAGAALIVRPHDFAVRSMAMLLIVGGAYLIRISNTRPSLGVAISQEEDIDAPKGPGRLSWALSIACLPLLGFSYFFLFSDHGSHGALPIYLFAGVGFACAVIWGYLLSKLMSRS
jgi:hypothetical protein